MWTTTTKTTEEKKRWRTDKRPIGACLTALKTAPPEHGLGTVLREYPRYVSSYTEIIARIVDYVQTAQPSSTIDAIDTIDFVLDFESSKVGWGLFRVLWRMCREHAERFVCAKMEMCMSEGVEARVRRFALKVMERLVFEVEGERVAVSEEMDRAMASCVIVGHPPTRFTLAMSKMYARIETPRSLPRLLDFLCSRPPIPSAPPSSHRLYHLAVRSPHWDPLSHSRVPPKVSIARFLSMVREARTCETRMVHLCYIVSLLRSVEKLKNALEDELVDLCFERESDLSLCLFQTLSLTPSSHPRYYSPPTLTDHGKRLLAQALSSNPQRTLWSMSHIPGAMAGLLHSDARPTVLSPQDAPEVVMKCFGTWLSHGTKEGYDACGELVRVEYLSPEEVVERVSQVVEKGSRNEGGGEEEAEEEWWEGLALVVSNLVKARSSRALLTHVLRIDDTSTLFMKRLLPKLRVPLDSIMLNLFLKNPHMQVVCATLKAISMRWEVEHVKKTLAFVLCLLGEKVEGREELEKLESEGVAGVTDVVAHLATRSPETLGGVLQPSTSHSSPAPPSFCTKVLACNALTAAMRRIADRDPTVHEEDANKAWREWCTGELELRWLEELAREGTGEGPKWGVLVCAGMQMAKQLLSSFNEHLNPGVIRSIQSILHHILRQSRAPARPLPLAVQTTAFKLALVLGVTRPDAAPNVHGEE